MPTFKQDKAALAWALSTSGRAALDFSTDMSETTGQTIAGIYTLLRRPSQQKLPYTDVAERLNDVLKGLVQEMGLGGREHRLMTDQVEIIPDDIDFLVSLPNVPDFEPVRLEYGFGYTGGREVWWEATVVPQSAWTRHFSQPYIAASFSGSSGLPEGQKVRLNISPDEAARYRWRLSYRLPLLAIVQLGEFPPIPSNFLPMLKLLTATTLMPVVDDDSAEWQRWMEFTAPIYTADLAQWKERWQEYIYSSTEPLIQPIPPWNYFRRSLGQRRYRSPRAYLPIS